MLKRHFEYSHAIWKYSWDPQCSHFDATKSTISASVNGYLLVVSNASGSYKWHYTYLHLVKPRLTEGWL